MKPGDLCILSNYEAGKSPWPSKPERIMEKEIGSLVLVKQLSEDYVRGEAFLRSNDSHFYRGSHIASKEHLTMFWFNKNQLEVLEEHDMEYWEEKQ